MFPLQYLLWLAVAPLGSPDWILFGQAGTSLAQFFFVHEERLRCSWIESSEVWVKPMKKMLNFGRIQEVNQTWIVYCQNLSFDGQTWVTVA